MLQHLSRRIRYLDEQLVKLLSSENVSDRAREALTNARAVSEYPPQDGSQNEIAKVTSASGSSLR
jgi:hypothetical protein